MAEAITEELLYKKTSQELTTLLYEQLLERMNLAIVAINNKEYMEANQLLQKCNDILYRLGAGLNYEAGIIADELDALYNYMSEKLIEANRRKTIEPIAEAIKVTEQIKSAWDIALNNKEENSIQLLHKQRQSAYDK